MKAVAIFSSLVILLLIFAVVGWILSSRPRSVTYKQSYPYPVPVWYESTPDVYIFDRVWDYPGWKFPWFAGGGGGRHGGHHPGHPPAPPSPPPAPPAPPSPPPAPPSPPPAPPSPPPAPPSPPPAPPAPPSPPPAPPAPSPSPGSEGFCNYPF